MSSWRIDTDSLQSKCLITRLSLPIKLRPRITKSSASKSRPQDSTVAILLCKRKTASMWDSGCLMVSWSCTLQISHRLPHTTSWLANSMLRRAGNANASIIRQATQPTLCTKRAVGLLDQSISVRAPSIRQAAKPPSWRYKETLQSQKQMNKELLNEILQLRELQETLTK
jgi:hypothetical protein